MTTQLTIENANSLLESIVGSPRGLLGTQDDCWLWFDRNSNGDLMINESDGACEKWDQPLTVQHVTMFARQWLKAVQS